MSASAMERVQFGRNMNAGRKPSLRIMKDGKTASRKEIAHLMRVPYARHSSVMERKSFEPAVRRPTMYATARFRSHRLDLVFESAISITNSGQMFQKYLSSHFKKLRLPSISDTLEPLGSPEAGIDDYSLTPDGSRRFFELMSRPNPAAVETIKQGRLMLSKDQLAKLGKERVAARLMVKPSSDG